MQSLLNTLYSVEWPASSLLRCNYRPCGCRWNIITQLQLHWTVIRSWMLKRPSVMLRPPAMKRPPTMTVVRRQQKVRIHPSTTCAVCCHSIGLSLTIARYIIYANTPSPTGSHTHTHFYRHMHKYTDIRTSCYRVGTFETCTYAKHM